MATTQENRILNITSPLGEDVLLLAGFRGTERISGLFHFELDLWSENLDVVATDIVGKNVTFEIKLGDDSSRLFHGTVCRFVAGVRRDKLRYYRAEVVPWLWYLTRTLDCKIFQKEGQTVPDILETVFKAGGFTDYDIAGIKGDHPAGAYRVQYRESAFDFASRLLEHEGIFYFFKHEDGKHTLMLADDNTAFQDNTLAEVKYVAHLDEVLWEQGISQWEHRYEYRVGKWSQTDFNFIDHPPGPPDSGPNFKHLFATSDSTLKLQSISSFECYDYPGGYDKLDVGKSYTSARIQADDAGYHIVYGQSSCSEFVPGTKFKLAGHNVTAENGKQYVLTSVTHQAQADAGFRMTDTNGSATNKADIYLNQFTCIPADVPFRPPLITPRPAIYGTQTAVVVGPDGEEIWTDKYGRVQVQFHWDRDGNRDDKGVYWLRCAQSAAGSTWGSLFLPRIGQEVVVTFLDGDPDRPLVTGVVYNSGLMPPYTLPDNKTISVIKTRSSTKGDVETYNELRFEDKKDAEHVYFHAQKDFVRVVENNDVLDVGFDNKYGLKIEPEGEGNQTITIKNNRTVTIQEGNEKLEVSKGNRDVIVSEGNDSHAITKGNRVVTIDGGNDTLTIAKGNRETTISQGNHTLTIAAGTSLIDAKQSLKLVVGQSSILLEPSQITIQSTQILIQGDSQADLKAATVNVTGDAQVNMKGPMVVVSGDGSLKLSGGVVNIN